MTFGSFEFALQAAGIVTVLIGIGHTAFHRIFGWKRAFASISVHNAKVFTTIHIGSTIFLYLVGALTLRYSALLSQSTEPASVLCVSLSLFWSWRLLWQLTYFKPSPIKQDTRFLVMHYAFTLSFAFLVAAYGAPVAARLWSA
ncbi:MAG: hypothetical protein HZB63_04765 [Deltaproteobacteria bacterium]|nr:hypothetical protein [Deltaproteobacteria bacterium]